MEPCKAIPNKPFLLKKENNCEEEIKVTPQDWIGNTDWWKSECKLMVTFAESFCLLVRLKSQSTRGASCHSPFVANCFVSFC